MALSNIFREPRREITETVVGLLAFSLPMWAIFRLALWMRAADRPPILPLICYLVVATVVVALFFTFGGLILFLIHEAGEWICDGLQERGIHLRPRDRK